MAQVDLDHSRTAFNSSNQLRLVTSLRRDYFQIPYDPFPNDIENNPVDGQFPSIGLRDGEHEADAGVLFTWVQHIQFTSAADGLRLSTTTTAAITAARRRILQLPPRKIGIRLTQEAKQVLLQIINITICRAGFLGFYQGDNQLFGAINYGDGSSNLPITDPEHPNAHPEHFILTTNLNHFRRL